MPPPGDPSQPDPFGGGPGHFPPGGGGNPPPGDSGRMVDPDAAPDTRTYAIFMHLMLPIATFTVVPLVLGPLIMWLIKKDQSRFIDDHGKEALNFNLSTLLYYILLIPVGFVTCGVGWYIFMPLVWIVSNIFSILAAIAANRGEYYRYPACIRIIA